MDKGSVARFVGLIVSLLAYFGINVPQSVTEAIIGIIAGVIAIYAAWRNNNFTKEARQAQGYLDQLKKERS